MGLYQERHDRLVKLAFGAGARFDGDFGTPSLPGAVRIILDGRTIGTGRTFSAALADVTHRLCSTPRTRRCASNAVARQA
jgi:hypothetical protein